MKTRLISMALAAGLSGCDQFVGPTEGYGDLDIFVPVRNNVQLTPPLARRSESIGEQQWPNDVASEYQTAASAYMLIWAYFESPGPDEFYTRAWVHQDFAYTGTDASTKLSLRLSHVGNNSAGTTLSSENAASNLFPFPERNLRDSLWTTVQDECGTTVSGSGFGNSSIQAWSPGFGTVTWGRQFDTGNASASQRPCESGGGGSGSGEAGFGHGSVGIVWAETCHYVATIVNGWVTEVELIECEWSQV